MEDKDKTPEQIAQEVAENFSFIGVAALAMGFAADNSPQRKLQDLDPGTLTSTQLRLWNEIMADRDAHISSPPAS